MRGPTRLTRVAWLAMGALFFTLRFQFVNVRGFRHGLDCVRGHFGEPGDHGGVHPSRAVHAIESWLSRVRAEET